MVPAKGRVDSQRCESILPQIVRICNATCVPVLPVPRRGTRHVGVVITFEARSADNFFGGSYRKDVQCGSRDVAPLLIAAARVRLVNQLSLPS